MDNLKSVIDSISNLEEDSRALMRKVESNFYKLEELNKLKNKLSGTNFYVYLVYVDGHLKYIGKGSGDRWKHAIRGASSVPELNRDHFAGKYIEVRLCKHKNLTEAQAFKLEADIIYTHLVTDDKSRGFYSHTTWKDLKTTKMCMGSLYNKMFPPQGEYLNTSLLEFSTPIRDDVSHNGACMIKRNETLKKILPDEWNIYENGGNNKDKISGYSEDGVDMVYKEQVEICWNGYTRVVLCEVVEK